MSFLLCCTKSESAAKASAVLPPYSPFSVTAALSGKLLPYEPLPSSRATHTPRNGKSPGKRSGPNKIHQAAISFSFSVYCHQDVCKKNVIWQDVVKSHHFR